MAARVSTGARYPAPCTIADGSRGDYACMSDQAERQLAVDPARSVIVQAPAGSGKTTLLVERYLGLLAVVDEPEEILAITFTRKAAAEMRHRILQYLDPVYTSDAPHEQAALNKARQVEDRVVEWGLRDNPQRMLIRTIDSFNHHLARTMPVASQLGPVPAPAENTAALYRQAARKVLDEIDGNDPLAADIRRLLLWRDHRSQDIEDLLVALLGKREQWLRVLGVTGQPERAHLETALQAVVTDQLAAAEEALERALSNAGIAADDLVEVLRLAASNLEAEGKAAPLSEASGMNRLPGADPDDLGLWRALGFALLTNGGTWRAGVNKNQGFPPDSEQKSRFEPLLDALRGDEELATLIDRARRLPRPHYDDAEWEVLASLVRVLERAAGELELVFAAAGQTDFAGLAAAALRGLGDETSGFTDLGLYLDQRIRHILVDEYQDTNWGQYHLLEKLTAGWQPGEPRSLFLVGDPMQSIYRFREAEVGLFMRTRDFGIGDHRLESRRLTQNFRSRAGIVEWVNNRLGPIFPETEDISAGAVAYAPSEAGRDHGGQVDILARPDAVQEAEAIAATLEEAFARHSDDADFSAAIIVRARSHLAEILPALERRGIRYRAVKLDPLLARPVVGDLMAITRSIVNPADTTARLAILRSPLCGLTLADLDRLAGLDRGLDDADSLDRLEGDARERAERVFGALDNAQKLWRRRPLRDLVEGLWHALGGEQLCRKPETDHADASRFLDAVSMAEAEGLLADWNDFLELLEGQFTEGDPPSADVRLEILTMHGAKGLEWDLVVLPGLNRGARGQDRDLLYWLPLTTEHGDEQVLLAPLRSAEQDRNTPLIELIRSEQKARDDHEHQRLLYVAATRAREQLVLSACLDPEKDEIKPASGSLLADLWPTCGQDFLQALEQAPQVESPAGDATTVDQSIHRRPVGWEPPIGERLDWRPKLPPREREVEIEFNWAGIQARRTGTVLHRLLERVATLGIENLTDEIRQRLVDRVPALLKAMGTGPDDLDASARIIAEAFERTLDSDTGRWMLSNRHEQSACELPVTGLLDGELVNAVIDRTFIDETGTRWIIDYKSGYHEGADLEGFLEQEAERYHVQLANYRRLFEQMGETDIKTALYLPRHGALRIVQ